MNTISEYDVLAKVQKKEKLSINEQIEYLKYKGITFIYETEFDARRYLKENSYYYKVTSYRKNFSKDNNGKYSNIDFATLKDLAIIDMHLRYLVLQLSLDVEHCLKTKLLQLITDSDIDGFEIVKEYSDYQYNQIAKIKDLTQEQVSKRQSEFISPQEKIFKSASFANSHDKDLYDKHHNNPSIWILIELMTFGQLSSFIKFYVGQKKPGYNKLKIANEFMYLSKNIRDRAAHSRPILIDIAVTSDRNSSKLQLKQYLQTVNIPNERIKRFLSNRKMNDLCSLLLMHNTYVLGSGVRNARREDLMHLCERACREKYLYQHSHELKMVWLILYKLVRNY